MSTTASDPSSARHGPSSRPAGLGRNRADVPRPGPAAARAGRRGGPPGPGAQRVPRGATRRAAPQDRPDRHGRGAAPTGARDAGRGRPPRRGNPRRPGRPRRGGPTPRPGLTRLVRSAQPPATGPPVARGPLAPNGTRAGRRGPARPGQRVRGQPVQPRGRGLHRHRQGELQHHAAARGGAEPCPRHRAAPGDRQLGRQPGGAPAGAAVRRAGPPGGPARSCCCSQGGAGPARPGGGGAGPAHAPAGRQGPGPAYTLLGQCWEARAGAGGRDTPAGPPRARGPPGPGRPASGRHGGGRAYGSPGRQARPAHVRRLGPGRRHRPRADRPSPGPGADRPRRRCARARAAPAATVAPGPAGLSPRRGRGADPAGGTT